MNTNPQPAADVSGWDSPGWSDIYTGHVTHTPPPPPQPQAPEPPPPSYLELLGQSAARGLTLDPGNLLGW